MPRYTPRAWRDVAKTSLWFYQSLSIKVDSDVVDIQISALADNSVLHFDRFKKR